MLSVRRFMCQKFPLLKRRILEKNMDNQVEDLKNIFLKAVSAVDPQRLIRDNVKVNNGHLYVYDNTFPIRDNCYLVGFGKAVLGMAREMESILDGHLVCGIVSVPVGIFNVFPKHQSAAESGKVKYLEGAENNLPDEPAENAAKEILKLIKDLTEFDLLIVLISGGGSALLPLPKEEITLKDKTQLIQRLTSKGADIKELNCVRKRLSMVKGGGLAALAYPTPIVALILSDIIGDPLDFIASGPTVPNMDSSDDPIKIIEKYALEEQLSESVKNALTSEVENSMPSTSETFPHVTNFVIGNNRVAAIEAAATSRDLGYQTSVISLSVSGDVCVISETYTRIALEIAKVMKGISSTEKLRECLQEVQATLEISDETVNEVCGLQYHSQKGICLLAAGETTTEVKGKGKGGRNQQLALQFSIDLNRTMAMQHLDDDERIQNMNISLLSCGTDGIDGPTDAAGAIGFSTLHQLAEQQHMNPLTYIENNDSYSFYNTFQDGKYIIRTGHTGTNVMDIHVLMITNDDSK